MIAGGLLKLGSVKRNSCSKLFVRKGFSTSKHDNIVVRDLRGTKPDALKQESKPKETIISIDTSGLKQHSEHEHKKPRSDFEKYLNDAIRLRGPLSVATFMREVLTNPKYGYYMNRDVFGSSGDFTTSPEISQMFGELIGIWCVSVWMQMGKPPKVQLVEFGPGRGTLMHDILRAGKHFKEFYSAIDVHLIEMSPALREIQAKKLHTSYKEGIPTKIGSEKGEEGPSVQWYSYFAELPELPIIAVAQEFFDALPVHQFEKTSRGWMEKLIDIDDDPASDHLFKFVLSPGPTTASRSFLKGYKEGDIGDKIEVSPESSILAERIGLRISKNGGGALIIDYGEDFPMGDTLRAIKNHEFRGIFEDIGNCDLSCFVDFSALKKAVSKFTNVTPFGSVTQKDFLLEMGIEARMNVLMQKANEKQQKDLQSAIKRLTDTTDMGLIFKVLSLVNQKIGTPAGFYKYADSIVSDQNKLD